MFLMMTFNLLSLHKLNTLQATTLQALKIINTHPVPSSMPLSVHQSLVVPPHPVITPEPLTNSPVLTQVHNEHSPIITQDFDDDYSFVEPSNPTPIIARIKDPRPAHIIVRIKDPRPKLT